ncbi:MAG: hypothetical protein EXS05_08270 [Planctomycetaceae bacterium]|nr:hypothetical protein [Planctomycetaceae bacterium]
MKALSAILLVVVFVFLSRAIARPSPQEKPVPADSAPAGSGRAPLEAPTGAAGVQLDGPHQFNAIDAAFPIANEGLDGAPNDHNAVSPARGDDGDGSDDDDLNPNGELSIALHHLDAAKMRAILEITFPRQFKDKSLRIRSRPGSKALVFTGRSKILERVSKAVDVLDVLVPKGEAIDFRMRSIVVHLSNLTVRSVLETLRLAFADSPMEFEAEEGVSNGLMVSAPEESLDTVQKAIEKLDQMAGEEPAAEVKIFPLQHAQAIELRNSLEPLLELLNVRLSADPRTNALIATGSDDAMQRIEALLLYLDKPGAAPGAAPADAAVPAEAGAANENAPRTGAKTFKIFEFKHANAAELVDSFQPLLTLFNVTVVADNRTNTLIVAGSDDAIQLVEPLLSLLDKLRTVPAATTAGGATRAERPTREAAARIPQQKLAKDYQDRAQAAARIAGELLQLQMKSSPDESRVRQLTTQMRQTVAELFAARQQLQRAELDRLRTRLDQLERSIQLREQFRTEIIERRIEELLHPERTWDAGEKSAVERPPATAPGRNQELGAPTGAVDAPRGATEKKTTDAEARSFDGQIERWSTLVQALADADSAIRKARTDLIEAEVNLRRAKVHLYNANDPLGVVQGEFTIAEARLKQATDDLAAAERQRQTVLATIAVQTRLQQFDVDKARMSVKQATANHARARPLHEKGYMSIAQFESAQFALEQAELQLQRAEELRKLYTESLPPSLPTPEERADREESPAAADATTPAPETDPPKPGNP